MTQTARPEFSFIVQPSALVEGGKAETFDLEAGPDECTALANRFGLLALEAFRAQVSVVQVGDGQRILLRGHFAARVVQSCVVTLDPVVANLDERFELILLPEGQRPEEAVEIEDDFENYSGDEIDIAEIVVGELALALDPYPRSPEAIAGTVGPGGLPPDSEEAGEADSTRHRPFQALAGLRRNK